MVAPDRSNRVQISAAGRKAAGFFIDRWRVGKVERDGPVRPLGRSEGEIRPPRACSNPQFPDSGLFERRDHWLPGLLLRQVLETQS